MGVIISVSVKYSGRDNYLSRVLARKHEQMPDQAIVATGFGTLLIVFRMRETIW